MTLTFVFVTNTSPIVLYPITVQVHIHLSSILMRCFKIYVTLKGHGMPGSMLYPYRVSGKGVHSFHLVVCLTTGPKPLPKRALHIVRSRASSFKLKYPLLSLRSSSSFLRLLPCLPVVVVFFLVFLSLLSLSPLYLSFNNPL